MRYPVLLNSILAAFMFLVGSLTLAAQESKDAAPLYKEAGQLQNASKFAVALKKWQQYLPATLTAVKVVAVCAPAPSSNTSSFALISHASTLASVRARAGKAPKRWKTLLDSGRISVFYAT